MKNLIWIAVIGVIGFIMFAYFHGRTADIYEGQLHDNCRLCSIYGYMSSDNPAFQMREMRRWEESRR